MAVPILGTKALLAEAKELKKMSELIQQMETEIELKLEKQDHQIKFSLERKIQKVLSNQSKISEKILTLDYI